MADETAPRLPWVPAFLAALAAGATVREAAKRAGITASTAHWLKREDAEFARDWRAAHSADKARIGAGPDQRRTPHWRKDFFEALAATSNVAASAARANVPAATVYRFRREDPEFAAKWLAALHEGYDNLEMELLGYLRNPQPGYKMDVGAATRLLGKHQDTVERLRALTSEEDKQATLESIDRFIEDIRRRRAANTAILNEEQSPNAAE